MITIDELKKKFINYGYYISDETLIYDTYIALCMIDENKSNESQDIFAMCFDGPPGAGKTEFAKIYTKLCEDLFGKENVERIEYQCDPTTSKENLFEDINITAVVSADASKVNIPGVLIEAIEKVNAGKKVILFLDEYDKAREETDAFMLQFLQDGKLKSNQHGIKEVKDEYKGNLQVIFCKNDLRAELSGPLSRRLRITRLDYMKPNIFYDVAKRILIDERPDNPVNEGYINLVTLMYQAAYEHGGLFTRLPSCSEMLIALEDSDRIFKMTDAPQNIIYKIILKNMFKAADDITTFETTVLQDKHQTNSGLINMIKKMKQSEEKADEKSINNLIAENVLSGTVKEYKEKIECLDKLIEEYTEKFKDMENKRQKTIEKELRQFEIANGELISEELSEIQSCFGDETQNIKRGHNILDLIYSNWTNVADVYFDNLSYQYFISKMIEYANQLSIKIYENGILISDNDDCKLILVKEKKDSEGKSRYRFMSSTPIIPSNYINQISAMLTYMVGIYKEQPVITKKGIREKDDIPKPYSLDALVYDENELLEYDKIENNVYRVQKDGLLDEEIPFTDNSTFTNKDYDKVSELVRKRIAGKGKVLTNGNN